MILLAVRWILIKLNRSDKIQQLHEYIAAIAFSWLISYTKLRPSLSRTHKTSKSFANQQNWTAELASTAHTNQAIMYLKYLVFSGQPGYSPVRTFFVRYHCTCRTSLVEQRKTTQNYNIFEACWVQILSLSWCNFLSKLVTVFWSYTVCCSSVSTWKINNLLCYDCVVFHPFILGCYVNYNYIIVIFIIATCISSHWLTCRYSI